MRRISLFCAAVILLAGSASICEAAEADAPASDTLSDYLHANGLPLVEGQSIVNESGERFVLLYGYVATDFSKFDAENLASDFMDDLDLAITDRIVVRPELLTMGTPGNSNSSADGTEPAADNAAADDGQEEADDQKWSKAGTCERPRPDRQP